jgi:hypothetical protein
MENITNSYKKDRDFEKERKERLEWEEKISNFTATDLLTFKIEANAKEVILF